MIADPTCDRCGRPKVWIGIGSGAVPVCLDGCAPVLPNTRCPKCRSFDIEPFDQWNGWYPPPADQHHCVPCGAVFAKKDAV